MTVVKIQRWPVLTREGRRVGRRTVAPVAEREETLVRLQSRSLALVTWGSANAEVFSLGTGRCAGSPDWLLTEESQQELRKLARKQFKRKRAKKAAEEESDEEGEGMSLTEIAEAIVGEPVPALAPVAAASDAESTEGG